MNNQSPIKTNTRTTTEYIVIHGSFTTASHDMTVEEVERWDRICGYFGIGYHFIITRDGKIHEGREHSLIGAHCGAYNPTALSILMIGGKSAEGRWEDNYTQEQRMSLAVMDEAWLPYPGATTISYRDLPGVLSKSPGF